MKKLLLFVCGLSLALGSFSAGAQTFLTQSGTQDTSKGYWSGTDDLTVGNHIKSATSNSVTLKWRISNYYLSPNWTIDGVCDNYGCYPASSITAGNSFVSDAYTQTYGDFHVTFLGVNGAAYNTFSYVKANLRDTVNNYSRDITLIGYKNNLGVNSTITSFDEVTVFPNPAREAVNVIFNEKAGVKTIAIYNLIGKVMNVYKLSDNGSAKLDIDNIPAGVYFLRLMDGKGHILATRRFTRQ